MIISHMRTDPSLESDGENAEHAARKHKAQDTKTASLKAQLKQMLAQPILVKGISAKYITSGNRQIIDDLLTGECEFPGNINGFHYRAYGISIQIMRICWA